jgi:hypothetical protein
MRKRFVLSSLLLAIVLLTGAACTGTENEGQSKPAAPASETVVPVASAPAAVATPVDTPATQRSPVLQTARVPFTWQPSEMLLDLGAAVEDPEPYAEAWASGQD